MSKKDNSVNITSQNQSGGITAQNVSTGNGDTPFNFNKKINHTEKEESSNFKKIVLIITGVVTFLAAIATILNYFDILPFTK